MSINAEWEQFQGGPAESPLTRAHATISYQGRIHLNGNLYRQMGKPVAVQLYFNRHRSQIALKSVSERMPFAFPLKANRTGGRYISAAPFCRHFGIKIDATHKFTTPEFTPDGRLILNLSQTTIVTRGKRKK